ncbi:hypothetical protein ABTX60_25570 [Streptomyces sp. NPDC126510]|uniref:hypothetical protein n=1 Tax=Streptomyces sp. NPDC126510 TaxID=3155317 RepID=UPI0033227555
MVVDRAGEGEGADTGAGWLGVDLRTRSVRAPLVTADGTVHGSGSAPPTGRRDGGTAGGNPVG